MKRLYGSSTEYECTFDREEVLGVLAQHTSPSRVEINLRGELDQYTSSTLKEALDEYLPLIPIGGSLIVNMELVTHLDSTGLAQLIHAARRLMNRQGRVALIITNDKLRVPFYSTGLNRTIFTIHSDIGQALANV